MARINMGLAGLLAAFALAGCTAPAPSSAPLKSTEAAPSPEPAPVGAARQVSEHTMTLVDIVAARSPLLSAAQKSAISKNVNGAPINEAFAVHTVTAQQISCRARTPSVGKGVSCLIRYSDTQAVEIAAPEAQELYDALGKVGVEDEGGMSHLERTLTALSCTVDDKAVQEAPGNAVGTGFKCQFTLE